MKLQLFIIAIFAFTFAAQARVSDDVKVDLHFDSSKDFLVDEVSADYLNIEVENVRFPKSRAKERMYKAFELLEIIVNSEEFKRKVLTYKGINDSGEYSKNYLWNDSTNRLSNEDVYKVIMNGDERMVPDTLGSANLNVKSYKSKWWFSKVIGWTNPKSNKNIHVNWRKYKNFKVESMASNLFHEWLHLVGFLHGKNQHQEVTYVVGGIVKELAVKHIQQNPGFLAN